jgi:hypothetical protein
MLQQMYLYMKGMNRQNIASGHLQQKTSQQAEERNPTKLSAPPELGPWCSNTIFQ